MASFKFCKKYGFYEKVTQNGVTRELYYIGGGDGLAAVYVKQAGQSDKIYYAHTDHLGSIVSLTDGNGTSVFKANYDAWGKQTVTQNTIGFHRGYTGHEHLPEFGLIDMNGRMYDPLLGRFLSPDNYVQLPDFSQNFNRYSYCFNNPLKYNDPSGEIAWLPILAMTYFGGMQANFMHAAKNGSNPFNPGNWNWKSPWTYVSIASSAAFGYSQTLEHCEWANDIVTGKRSFLSHLGEGKLNFERYGTWIDNRSAFVQLLPSVITEVPFGGVDNMQNIAAMAFAANSGLNSLNALLQAQPNQFINSYKSNGWERFRDNFGFVGDLGYNTIDQAWITTQRMVLQKLPDHIAHLNGAGLEGSELVDAGINTITTFAPISKISKTLDIAKAPLNAAKFNHLFKGTGIYAAKEGGVFIRQYNYVIRNNNNFQNVWKGVGFGSFVFSGF